jgi:hypothetical protein
VKHILKQNQQQDVVHLLIKVFHQSWLTKFKTQKNNSGAFQVPELIFYLLYFLEIRSRMFAQRTNEIFRQFLADVFITANSTSPNCLTCFGLSDWFRLRLDVI